MNAVFENAALSGGPRTPAIGLFDSGVGGLSVLRALRRRLPDTPMVYVGDVSHAPYGNRPPEEVVARSVRIVEWLVACGADLIVVPCNTATVLAIGALRARWPERQFVGVEPGVKPAASGSRKRRIAVMATAATVASERLRQLIDRHASDVHVHLQACPDLASVIERGVLEGPELDQVLLPACRAILAADVDTVVLGCTHYPFVAERIRELLGAGIELVDTADAIAARTVALWTAGIAGDAVGASRVQVQVQVLSTGATGTMQHLLRRCPGLEGTVVQSLRLPARIGEHHRA